MKFTRGAGTRELVKDDSKLTAEHAEGLLKGDSARSARLAATDERINRVLAAAVARHATYDPGVRGILKRASGAHHPESEPQKKIALDIEQNLAPHTPRHLRRIISIRNTTHRRHRH